MREFTKKGGLPKDISRWQPTVDQMLEQVDTKGPIYIMVDQGWVSPTQPHRRPGPHIDGYWIPSMQCHGGSGGDASSGNWKTGWSHQDFSQDEALLLASDVPSCIGYKGEFKGTIYDGGSVKEEEITSLDKVMLDSNTVYYGNVTMIHESIPYFEKTKRTLVRLNVPNWKM